MKKLLAFCLLGTLSGCATKTTSEINCPKIVIASELSKSVMFDPKGGAPLMRTELDSIRPKCELGSKDIEVGMLLRMTSFRKAGSTKSISSKVPYFVALVDSQGNILKKSEHVLTVDLGEKKSNKVSLEQVEETMPISGFENLKFVVGFLVSEDQLSFNQSARERRP